MPKKLIYFVPVLGLILAICLIFCDVGGATLSSVATSQNARSSQNKESVDEYFSTYDIENYLGDVDFTLPGEFGEMAADKYPSIYSPQTFPDLNSSIQDKKEVLNATSLGKIRIENERIMNEANQRIAEGNLQKHISADGQFFGEISDDAPRIEKRVTVNYNVASRHSLGVFAPAGEVLTVKVEQEIIDQTNDKNRLTLIVGYPFWENNVHEVAKQYFLKLQVAKNRMPILYKEFTITSTETKIGTPLGGMVFLKDIPNSITRNFDITISGGVDNPSYQLGISTVEDWEKVMEAPSPYAVLQTPFVYFFVPKMFIQDLEDPYNILMFWHKAASLSNYAMGLDQLKGKIKPVMMIFDSYIASNGAAQAYPGIFIAVCPTSWCSKTLDYNTMITTAEDWGVIHEMNHNFQYPNVRGLGNPWSVGSDFMENTNNVINVLTFLTYTDIASSRTETVGPSGGNWGNATDPYYNLKETLDIASRNANLNFNNYGTDKLYAYADLIHNFGVDKFLHFLRQIGGSEESEYLLPSQTLRVGSGYTKTDDGFATFASQFFQQDLTDYFTKLWHLDLSEETINTIKSFNYPKFFALQNLYAVGEKGVETGRAFRYNENIKSFDLDFNATTVSTADRFNARLAKNIKHASIKFDGNGIFTITPDGSNNEITFDLIYDVYFEGDNTTYTKTLRVKIQPTINYYVNATVYNVPQGNYNVKQAAAIVTDENIYKTKIVKNFSVNLERDENLVYYKANVVFDKTGEVTFMIYGDDQTYMKINGEEAACYSCLLSSQEKTAIAYSGNKITMTVQAYKPVYIEAYCLNWLGGVGSMFLKYTEDNITYKDILSSNCFNEEASDESIQRCIEESKVPHVYENQYNLQKDTLNSMYTSGVDRTKDIKSIKCVDKNGQTVPGQNTDHKIGNILDGDANSTWFTARFSVPFPHYYIFEFNEKTSVSNINIQFYDPTYTGTSYKYYVSDSENKEDYREIYTKDNSSLQTNVSDYFETATGKFFILEMLEGSLSDKRTSIREMTFNQSLNEEENVNVYSSKEELYTFDESWQKVRGGFINGYGKQATSGEFSFVLEGEDLLLYSLNEESQLYIDGEEYKVKASKSVNTPSLFIQGLENKRHAVKIVGNEMTFDAIKTTGKLYEQETFIVSQLQAQNQIYTGGKLKPIVYYGGQALTENVDYTLVECENNQNVGVAQFAIKGIGLYKGQIASSFRILNDIANAELNVESFEFDNTYHVPVLKFGDTLLKEGEDYQILSIGDNKNVGEVQFTVEGLGWYGGEFSASFTIAQKTVKIEDVKISQIIEQSHTGKEIVPDVEIKVNVNGEEVVLQKGVDYDVEMSDNVEVGTATMTIKFKGNYSGERTITFEIVSSLNLGLIIGLACGGVCIIAIALAVYFIVKRKKIAKPENK